jgi:hypothetical protein
MRRRLTPRRRRLLETAAALGIFAVLAIAFFNPVFRGYTFSAIAGHESIQYPWAAHANHYPDAVQSDQANNVYPIQVDLNRELRDGEFPYWSPASFGGTPTLGTVYGVAFYPLRVLGALTLPAIWVHDLLLLFHVWLAGAAMFLLARRLSASWLGSVLAGVAWMFSPSWFGLALLEGNAILAALLPLTLWLVHRAVVGRSWPGAAGAGVLLALFVLGASVQPAVFLFTIAAGWGLLLGVAGRGRVTDRPWRDVLLGNLKFVVAFCTLGAMLSAFVILPESAQIADSARAAVPDATMRAQDVGLDDFSLIVSSKPPAITGDSVWALTFMGLAAAIAALAGLLSRRPGSGLARTLVVVFFLLMVGTALTEVARAVVPGFAYLSPLGRLLPFFALGACLLAAHGLDVLREWAARLAGPRWRPRMPAITGAGAALAILVTAIQLFHYDRDVNPPFQPRQAAFLYPSTPLVKALQRERDRSIAAGDRQRILPVRAAKATDPFAPFPFIGETPRLFGLENAGGYLNVIPERSRILTDVLGGKTPAEAQQPLVGADDAFFYSSAVTADGLRKVGADLIVTPPLANLTPPMRRDLRRTRARVIYSGADGAVFRVPRVQRAFVVDGVQTAPTKADALTRYLDPSFDVRRTLLLDGGDAAGQRTTPGTGPLKADVRIRPSGPSDRDVIVDTPRAGWLVVLDTYARGWAAKVNGKPATLRRGDFAYRAVRVPAGRSTVTMHYTTPGLRLGVAVSALGLLGALALLVGPGLRTRRRRLGTTLDEGAPAPAGVAAPTP